MKTDISALLSGARGDVRTQAELDELVRLARLLPPLLDFAKAYIELFRNSDMRPEDECHGLFSKALDAVELAEPGYRAKLTTS